MQPDDCSQGRLAASYISLSHREACLASTLKINGTPHEVDVDAAAVGATRRARHDRDQVRLLHRAVGGAATRSCTTKVGGIASCCGMAAQQPRAAATQGAENCLSHDGLAKVTTLPLTAWPAEQFRRYAAEVAGLNVDVIVAGNSPACLAAKNASKTIPIVIATMEDPVQQGFARASLTREAAHGAQPPDAGLPRTGLPFVSNCL